MQWMSVLFWTPFTSIVKTKTVQMFFTMVLFRTVQKKVLWETQNVYFVASLRKGAFTLHSDLASMICPREPISSSGQFLVAFTPAAETLKQLTVTSLIHNIYKNQQPGNGVHRIRSCFCYVVGFVIMEMECKYTIYAIERVWKSD